jgi:hypothetical protein
MPQSEEFLTTNLPDKMKEQYWAHIPCLTPLPAL